MLRLLLFVFTVTLIGWGFTLLIGETGDIVLIIGQTRITSTATTAAAFIIVALILLYILWSLLKMIITSPFFAHQRYKEHRRERSYQALGRGLLAVLSGDSVGARRFMKKINDRLDDDDRALRQLLEAQVLLLEHDKGGAIATYEKMRENKDSRALGLFGLYREATNAGAYEAAENYASEALTLQPTLAWANRAVLNKLAREGNWQQAIDLYDRYERAAPRTLRASEEQIMLKTVLYTGLAIDQFPLNPEEARRVALKAHKTLPHFVPAANVAAAILYKLHEERKANRLIETIWQSVPHPDLAATYLLGLGTTSAQQQLKKARMLADKNSESFQSWMCLAHAAFHAQEFKLARRSVEKALKIEAFEQCFLLLADIEEATTGDQGRIKYFLSLALKAPLDRKWMADGMILDEWRALSPISGRLGAVEWRSPARQMTGQSIETADLAQIEKKAPASLNEQRNARPRVGKKPRSNSTTDEMNPYVIDAIADDLPVNSDHTRERLNVDDPGVSKDA